MKDQNLEKQVTFRVPEKDFEKLVKIVGPYGKLAPLLRSLITEFIKKTERFISKNESQ